MSKLLPKDADERILLDVSRMDPEGEDLSGETGDVLDLNDEYITPLGGIIYDLTAQLFDSELLVRGTLAHDFDMVCSRCGETFDDRIKVEDFTASFEIDEKSEYVDLTETARESIILALPTYPVCGEDCKGLCPKCGANLNKGKCTCKEESGDGRWGALDALKL